jgi:trk system potassium uptake protein TrkH
MVAPALVGLGYGETGLSRIYATFSLITLFAGGALIMATRGQVRRLGRREGILLAIFGWSLLPAFGALPLLFGAATETFTDSYFEALSGLTTTGATIIHDLSATAYTHLFWRAEMQWLGGLATIMLAMTLFSDSAVQGSSLYRSALPTGDRQSLGVRLAYSVRSVWWIYACMTALCAFSLFAAGMTGFDAVAHAFSTMSSGGFSTRSGSIAEFDNPWIEIVLIAFMFAAAINFTLHWALFHGRPREYFGDPEARYLFVLILIGSIILAILLFGLAHEHGVTAVRRALFNMTSMITTTGFYSVDPIAPWPLIAVFLLLVFQTIGGSTTSTAGGIKLMRLSLIFKQSARELARLSHPHGVVRLHYGLQPVADGAMRGVWTFFVTFFAVLVFIAIVLGLLGMDFRTAICAAIAVITNTGPPFPLFSGLETGFSGLQTATKWVLSAGMLMGRLELLALLAIASPLFWRD